MGDISDGGVLLEHYGNCFEMFPFVATAHHTMTIYEDACPVVNWLST